MSYTILSTGARSQPRVSYFAHGLLLLMLSAWTHALQISYCSPDNTAGTNFSKLTFAADPVNPLTPYLVTSIYMSDGKCQDNCQGGYAFAVLLGQSCWCSNYIPANQDETSLCDDSCPGFPSDTCGNQARGLYGYFALGKAPSGTAGASSPSSAASTSSPSPSVSTIFVPITPGSSSVPVRSSRSSASAFSFSVDVSVLTPYVPSQSSAESSSSSLSSSTVSEIISHTLSSTSFLPILPPCVLASRHSPPIFHIHPLRKNQLTIHI